MRSLAFLLPLIAASAAVGQNCPNLILEAPPGMLNKGVPAVFRVRTAQAVDSSGLHFDWDVSSGRIIGGHGTAEATILPEIPGANLTVAVNASKGNVICENGDGPGQAGQRKVSSTRLPQDRGLPETSWRS